MKTGLKQLYKKIDAGHPFIGILLRKIFHRFSPRTIRRIIRGKNNTINCKDALLASVVFDIKGDNNSVKIKEGCIVNNVKFYIRGNNHSIFIDKHCRFNSGGNIWCEDNDCSLRVGEGSTFEDVHLAITEPGSRITIGRDCMFAYDIDVRTGDSHSIICQASRERLNFAKDISIADHVWIAAHSILLKGTSIPEDSIVATGSVVTRPYTNKGIIIAGNPARQIKEGITWSRERMYKR